MQATQGEAVQGEATSRRKAVISLTVLGNARMLRRHPGTLHGLCEQLAMLSHHSTDAARLFLFLQASHKVKSDIEFMLCWRSTPSSKQWTLRCWTWEPSLLPLGAPKSMPAPTTRPCWRPLFCGAEMRE